ncbi:MAG: substrate-binding domain-containing protein [Clostridia bacterium]|nr:substrate-binding domain-containing protein [Clostridia bacterium]
MKKILAILLVLMMTVALCAGAVAEEKMYIPVMAKGFQHQFWQTVAAGAQAAADQYGVEIYFDGPASETNIDEQVEMLKNEMAKAPKAIALAALSTDSVMTELQECLDKGIPVIGFDSGVPDAPEGSIYATASTNNENAAALAAEKMMEQEGFADMLKAATADAPVVIAVISQEAVSGSIVGRTTGFVNKMVELASQYNTVSVTGHDLWKNEVEGAGVVIHVQISATTEATDVATASNAVLNMDNLKAVFLSNEGAVTGFLAATADGSELGEGGRYADLMVAGFDAGATQKNAVRNGWFIGSVTQDPYMIGFYAVELAVKAANGEAVADVDTGAQWYNAENIDDEMISMLVYD